MTPTLLAYQIDPKKLGKMQIVCLRLGIRVQAVDPADFGQTIGALAGVLPREPDAPAAPLPGEMLVMAHFRPGLLEGMLQGWRAAHIPPVALKAMQTRTPPGRPPRSMPRSPKSTPPCTAAAARTRREISRFTAKNRLTSVHACTMLWTQVCTYRQSGEESLTAFVFAADIAKGSRL